MGGNAFKHEAYSTGQILIEDVEDTLQFFQKKVLDFCGVLSYCKIGSTGKKKISGDLDIAVGPFCFSSQKEKQLVKKQLFEKIKKICGDLNVKIVGHNICVRFPVSNKDNEHVQIDLMLSSNLENTSWLMSGAGEGVKGLYRNLLLSYLAKMKSDEARKITLSFPGGIQVIENGIVVIERSEDPNVILSCLCLTAKPSETLTFEGLVTILVRTWDFSESLQGYQKYIESLTNDPQKSNDAKLSIEVFKFLA
jgi:hypothetical protein